MEGEFYRDSALKNISDPSLRKTIHHSMLSSLADIHAIDVDKTNLQEYGKRVSAANTAAQSGYILRQVKTWTRQYEATKTETIESMDNLIQNLPKCLPASAEKTSCLVTPAS